jgi:hypothetical protein
VLLLATAVAVFVLVRTEGGFGVSVWGPLGVGLIALVAILILAGRRASRPVVLGAAALLAVGLWSLASTLWGGLPGPAWVDLDQSLVAAAALLAGSLLAGASAARSAALLGTLAGLTALALELIVRLAWDAGPPGWLDGRLLNGPTGYHNALGLAFAMGVPLALWAAHLPARIVRAAGGASAAFLVSALLLTQSRGALVAVALAVIAQTLFTRSLRLAALAGCAVVVAVVMAFQLGHVDHALVTGDAAGQLRALRFYAAWAGALALPFAVAAASDPRSRVLPELRGTVALWVVAGLLVVAGAAFGLSGELRDRASDWLSDTTSETDPSAAAAGATRFASASLSGRKDMWRVAGSMAGDSPLWGAGAGQFARTWTRERTLEFQNALHPHSIELERLSELGLVGLAGFAAFVACCALGLARAPSRTDAGGALGVLAAVLVQSSVDWTWAFPGIVAPALFVVGASSGAPDPRRLGAAGAGAVTLAAVLCVVLVGGPYFADRRLAEASRLQTSDPAEAWQLVEEARSLDPWDPDGPRLQGRLLEASGEYRQAAARYEDAARLSQRPWALRFEQARALALAGARRESREACARAFAENPLDQVLRYRCGKV